MRFKNYYLLEYSIEHDEDRKRGLKSISIEENGKVLSKLTYSENPITTYTTNKDPSKYINIEWVETNKEHLRKGYADTLIKELKKKYPNKILIAHPNDLSRNVLTKNGVIDTSKETK